MSRGIDLIFEVWGSRMGHVFTPCKNPRTGEWTEQSFLWPKERSKIRDWILQTESEKKNIYWCPTLFSQSIRKKEYIKAVQVLWADLDEVKPTKIPRNIRPHLAYETSPKRYQALWYLNKDYDPEEAESVNRNLTYFVGADSGGWDLTQVLRIPGLRNFKYEKGPQGKILWDEVDEKSLKYYQKRVPEHEEIDVEDEDIEWADPDELISIVSRYKKQLKGKLFDLIFASEEEVEEYDRSAKLWEIECRLFEVGVETSDVANIVRLSNWNKYRGRNDEKKRIINEVLKAKAEVEAAQEDKAHKFEGRTGRVFDSYSDLMGLPTADPGWLIEGWWQKSSHGMVAGEPKTYKSTFVADFAASVASGRPLYGQFPVHTKGPVIMIQEENSPFLMKDRFRKIANHKKLLAGKVKLRSRTSLDVRFPPNLPISFLNNKGFDFTEEESRELVEKEIKKVKPVLVIFDPLYLMLGGKDENSSKDIRPVLNWLLNLRYQYNTAIMVVHHWNKGGQSPRGGQRMLGSVVFHGWVESAVYNSVKSEQDHEVTVDREFRSFPKPKTVDVRYNMGNPGDDHYEPVVSASEEVDDNDGLFQFISSSNGVTEQEVMDATGMSRQTVRTALDKLKKKGLIYCEKDGRSNKWFATKVEVDQE